MGGRRLRAKIRGAGLRGRRYQGEPVSGGAGLKGSPYLANTFGWFQPPLPLLH